MRRILLAALLASAPATLQAQWQIAVRHGNATSHGDARADLDPTHPELQAYRPGTWTVALARDAGPWRLGLDFRRTTADLAELGASSTVTTNSLLAAWGIGMEASVRVAGQPDGASLHMGAGAVIDRWTFDVADNAPRTRVAGRGSLEAGLPVAGRWRAMIRAELLAGPSVFRADELPAGFSTRPATRIGIAMGVAHQW